MEDVDHSLLLDFCHTTLSSIILTYSGRLVTRLHRAVLVARLIEDRSHLSRVMTCIAGLIAELDKAVTDFSGDAYGAHKVNAWCLESEKK